MTKRPIILVGMSGGLLWAVAVLWLGTKIATKDIWSATLAEDLAIAFFLPGLVTLAMIGRLAPRRFLDDQIIDGQPFPADSPAAIARFRVCSHILCHGLGRDLVCCWGIDAILIQRDQRTDMAHAPN